MPLSNDERRVLDFERSWWLESGTKGDRIRGLLGLSPAGYYAALRRLLQNGDALAYDPLLVRRLRRRDDERRRSRYQAPPASPPLRRPR